MAELPSAKMLLQQPEGGPEEAPSDVVAQQLARRPQVGWLESWAQQAGGSDSVFSSKAATHPDTILVSSATATGKNIDLQCDVLVSKQACTRPA